MDANRAERAYLVLADGTVFEGVPFGARGTTIGEAVFTTAMTGYQEVLTDPSFTGQLVVMTAPEIGNVGINEEDCESLDGLPKVSGFVIRQLSPCVSNWRAHESLDTYLARHGVVGIAEIDTRRLTQHLRDHGAQNAAIGCDSPAELFTAAQKAPSMAGLNLVERVTPPEPYRFSEGRGVWADAIVRRGGSRPHVVALDFGMKKNILRCLVDAGCDITGVPAKTSAAEVLSFKPDGIFLSNGPGDPAAVTDAIETIRALLGKKPIFGICLGHQLLSLALGAKTYKLKFGHRGTNQPVFDLANERVAITTQNHGFCVDTSTLPARAEPTHRHLNDHTNEGLRLRDMQAMSVQFHPEAAAGPHDCLSLFEDFVSWMAVGTR